MAGSICGGSILQGLSVVEIAVAGRGHDHFMAGLCSLHPSADALQDSLQSVLAQLSFLMRKGLLSCKRPGREHARLPKSPSTTRDECEGERQLRGGGKQLSRIKVAESCDLASRTSTLKVD